MADVPAEEIALIEARIAVLTRRLRLRETQIAAYGRLDVPPHIVLDKEEAERELALARAELRRLRPEIVSQRAPYLGLLTFQETDADRFFGREALTAALLDHLRSTTFLAVLGPSGSGKSSVVRAGLIPLLKGGALPGSDCWRYVTLKPGARPLNALAAALAEAHGGSLGDAAAIRDALRAGDDALLLAADMLLAGQDGARLALVVDQAEELWTLEPAEPEARTAFLGQQQRPFIRLLLTATGAPNSPVVVVLTMRADFLHRAAEYRELSEQIQRHLVIVGPMTADELRAAIVRPAEAAGVRFEPGLVDELMKETLGQPGALPLLEYTLLELWKERHPDGTLTWEAFRRIGGVEGGLARRADEILARQYAPEQRDELRAVLLRLVQPGEGAADTRRRVWLDDLVPAGSSVEAVQALLKPLVDERLITTGRDPATGEEVVEVSHEALIRAWPTLATWMSEARADLRLQIQLEEAAREWVASGESPDFLWGGLRLANVEAWIERAHPRLSARDQRFLEASRAAPQARRAAEEAARQRELEQARALAAGAVRLRRRAMYLAGALVAALVAVALAGWAWYRATVQERSAIGQYLVATGQVRAEAQPLLGLRLALEGLARVPADDPAHPAVVSATLQLVRQGRLQKLANDASQELFSAPDGSVFVLARRDAQGELRRTSDGKLITTLAGIVDWVTFNPNGTAFVVGYTDQPGELRRLDNGVVVPLTSIVDSQVRVWRAPAPDTQVVLPLTSMVGFQGVTFSPDGRAFVVHYADHPGELRRIDSAAVVPLTDRVTFLGTVIFSPGGSAVLVVYQDQPAELRWVDSGAVIPLAGSIQLVTFSPDDRFFVVQYADRPGELRRTRDGELVTTLTDTVTQAIFSPDSQALIVDYQNRPGELRRMDSGAVIPLTSNVWGATFSPDGRFFAVHYEDLLVELRRAGDGAVIPLTGSVQEVMFSPNGQAFVVIYQDRPGELRRTDGGAVVPLADKINEVTFSPDGRAFVVAYQGRPGELRRIDSGAVVQLAGRVEFGGVTFSPDGRAFVVRYADRPGELRWVDNGTVVPLVDPNIFGTVTFSRDSSAFVVSYGDGHTELWDAQGTLGRLANLGLGVGQPIFDPQATRLVVRYSTGQVYLLDIAWLRTIASYPATLSLDELIAQTCAGPLAGFDEAALAPYLQGRMPEACR